MGRKRPYTIEEDRIICEGVDADHTWYHIAASLHSRDMMSVRMRYATLREMSDKFKSLEAYHASLK